MDELKLYQVGGVDDYLEASSFGDSIQIECYEPWSGDNETGFGQGGSVQLTKEQAIELANWLLEKAKDMK